MKRFLSFMLVAIMLLLTFALTSCDPVNDVKSFVNKVLGKEEETRYTITENEWNTAFNVANYTVSMESDGYSIVAELAYPYMKYAMSVPGAGDEYNQTVFMNLSTGELYAQQDSEWVKANAGDTADESEVALKNEMVDIKFADLSYDEASKAYTYKDEDTYYSFKFENGKLVSIEMLSVDVSISARQTVTNIGTTTVEMPQV